MVNKPKSLTFFLRFFERLDVHLSSEILAYRSKVRHRLTDQPSRSLLQLGVCTKNVSVRHNKEDSREQRKRDEPENVNIPFKFPIFSTSPR